MNELDQEKRKPRRPLSQSPVVGWLVLSLLVIAVLALPFMWR